MNIPFLKSLTIFIVINIFFCYGQFWSQLLHDQSIIGAVPGELQVSEWISETVYQRVISGQNPFGNAESVLYPFGITLANLEPGYGLIFVLLRPFFSVHQSMSIIIPLNMLFANIGMYLFLRRLKISPLVSFLIGLSYGYSTYLMPRTGGHVMYTAIYLFPWFFYFCHKLLFEKRSILRLFGSIGSAVIGSLTVFINMYFAIILGISSLMIIFVNLFLRKNIVLKIVRDSWKYLILSITVAIALLSPWLLAVYKLTKYSQMGTVSGWAGAIDFSSDLFGFFIPSQYARYYGKFVGPLTKNIEFSHGIFENFSYPGLLIFLSILLLIISYRSFARKYKTKLLPYMYGAGLFFLLTLGPFLHVAGRWWVQVEEGIRIVFPLPFALLHYIPFLNNIRSPGRLVIGFIFFSYILGAYILDHYGNKFKTNKRIILSCLLFFLIIFDQRFDDRGSYPTTQFPNELYEVIAHDNNFSTLLEIPFVVRDGFTYFGEYNSVVNVTGQLKHNKPIIGGYYGRIPDYYKSYYMNNPLFGYIGREIDNWKDINTPVKDSLLEWKNIDLSASEDVLDFLDIKYVILNEIINSSKTMRGTLESLGFAEVNRENLYSLWYREPNKREFLKIMMGDKKNVTYLGMGWHEPEMRSFRWAERKSSLMFKLSKKRKMILKLNVGSFYGSQTIQIYLNQHKVNDLTVSEDTQEYSVPIEQYINLGINTVDIIAESEIMPTEVIAGSEDKRKLSLKFVSAELVDKIEN